MRKGLIFGIILLVLLLITGSTQASYDYTTGRWLTQDPLGYIDGMNLYEYGQGDPVESLDPNGLLLIGYPPPALYPKQIDGHFYPILPYPLPIKYPTKCASDPDCKDYQKKYQNCLRRVDKGFVWCMTWHSILCMITCKDATPIYYKKCLAACAVASTYLCTSQKDSCRGYCDDMNSYCEGKRGRPGFPWWKCGFGNNEWQL